MLVQDYLRQFGTDALTAELGIKVKLYQEGLLILDYSQVDSPKSNPIVRECRSLILDTDFNVVSRSMDRFFNYGEMPETQAHIDFNKAVCFEKLDGSLIKLYNWKGTWYVATRGMAFAEGQVADFKMTFKELVWSALWIDSEEDFQLKCNTFLNSNYTYVCEVTSQYNRCVKHYFSNKLTLLCVRENSGEYTYVQDMSRYALGLGMSLPKEVHFSGMSECLEDVKGLKDLDEGYVLYQDGIPVCKIKSPTYVAVHHIKGEGLTEKRICQLIVSGEVEEYLSYFPDDTPMIRPYIEAYNLLVKEINSVWEKTCHIPDQKEFALAVNCYAFSSVLFFSRRANTSPADAFSRQKEDSRISMLLKLKAG